MNTRLVSGRVNRSKMGRSSTRYSTHRLVSINFMLMCPPGTPRSFLSSILYLYASAEVFSQRRKITYHRIDRRKEISKIESLRYYLDSLFLYIRFELFYSAALFFCVCIFNIYFFPLCERLPAKTNEMETLLCWLSLGRVPMV